MCCSDNKLDIVVLALFRTFQSTHYLVFSPHTLFLIETKLDLETAYNG